MLNIGLYRYSKPVRNSSGTSTSSQFCHSPPRHPPKFVSNMKEASGASNQPTNEALDPRLVYVFHRRTNHSCYRAQLADEERTHLSGYLSSNTPTQPPALDLNAIRERLPVLELEGFYDSIRALTDYGPTFQKLVSIRGFPEETLAEIGTFPEHMFVKFTDFFCPFRYSHQFQAEETRFPSHYD